MTSIRIDTRIHVNGSIELTEGEVLDALRRAIEGRDVAIFPESREQQLARHRRFDVGHEMVLPERAGKDHR